MVHHYFNEFNITKVTVKLGDWTHIKPDFGNVLSGQFTFTEQIHLFYAPDPALSGSDTIVMSTKYITIFTCAANAYLCL